jgi:hypothetical protein
MHSSQGREGPAAGAYGFCRWVKATILQSSAVFQWIELSEKSKSIVPEQGSAVLEKVRCI